MFGSPGNYVYTYTNGHTNADKYPSYHISFPDSKADQDTYPSGATCSRPDGHTYPDYCALYDEGLYARTAFDANRMAHAHGYANTDPHTCHNWNSGRVKQNNALIITRQCKFRLVEYHLSKCDNL